MRFYRVHFKTDGGTSEGFDFFTSKAEAAKARKIAADANDELDQPDEVEQIDIEPTRAGILDALRLYGAHADNG